MTFLVVLILFSSNLLGSNEDLLGIEFPSGLVDLMGVDPDCLIEKMDVGSKKAFADACTDCLTKICSGQYDPLACFDCYKGYFENISEAFRTALQECKEPSEGAKEVDLELVGIVLTQSTGSLVANEHVRLYVVVRNVGRKVGWTEVKELSARFTVYNEEGRDITANCVVDKSDYPSVDLTLWGDFERGDQFRSYGWGQMAFPSHGEFKVTGELCCIGPKDSNSANDSSSYVFWVEGNKAPTVTAVCPKTVAVGEMFRVTARWSDPDSRIDEATWDIDGDGEWDYKADGEGQWVRDASGETQAHCGVFGECVDTNPYDEVNEVFSRASEGEWTVPIRFHYDLAATHTITLAITDQAGAIGTDTSQITVIVPEAEFTSPTGRQQTSYKGTIDVGIHVYFKDVDSVEFYYGSAEGDPGSRRIGEATKDGRHWSLRWDTTALEDGSYIVEARVFKSESLLETAYSDPFTLNNYYEPFCEIVSPKGGETYGQGSIEVSALATPRNAGFVDFWYGQDGKRLGFIGRVYEPKEYYWSCTWYTTSIEDGDYEVFAEVWKQGYVAEDVTACTIDNISIRILNVKAGETITADRVVAETKNVTGETIDVVRFEWWPHAHKPIVIGDDDAPTERTGNMEWSVDWKIDRTYRYQENGFILAQAYSRSGEIVAEATVTGLTLRFPPVADAGSDAQVGLGQPITLDGSASYDLDGFIVRYEWYRLPIEPERWISEQPGVAFSSKAQYDAFGRNPVSYELLVGDDDGLRDTDEVTITLAVPDLESADKDISFAWPAGPNASWKQYPNAGDSVAITVRVHNIGNADCAPFDVGFFVYPDSQQPLTTVACNGLPAGGQTKVSTTWVAIGGEHTICAAADYRRGMGIEGRIVEWDEDNNEGCSQITVNYPPTADAGPDQTVNVGQSVTLDGSTSSDQDGQIVQYQWDFGDQTAPGTGQTANHIYNAAGVYTVTLMVTDDNGATGTDTARITVEQNGSGDDDEPPGDYSIVKFQGTTTIPESHSEEGAWACYGSYYTQVNVEQIISDPNNVLLKPPRPGGFIICYGGNSLGIGKGTKVEVYGAYYTMAPMQWMLNIKAYGGDGYYIRKLEADGGLTAKLWVDKGCGATYAIGERITISFEVNRSASVTIYDYATDGSTQTIFSRTVSAGTNSISATVSRPPGTEKLEIVAQAGGETTTDTCTFYIGSSGPGDSTTVTLTVKAMARVLVGPITMNIGINVPIQLNGVSQTTPFSESLGKGSLVTLVAPIQAITLFGPLYFDGWLRNDERFSGNTQIGVTLYENTTFTAQYVPRD